MADKAKVKVKIELDEAEAKKLEKRVDQVAKQVDRMQQSVEKSRAADAAKASAAAEKAQKEEQKRLEAAKRRAEEEARLVTERVEREARIAATMEKSRAQPINPLFGGEITQVGAQDEKINRFINLARQAGVEQQYLATLITKGEQAAQRELEKTLGLKSQSNLMTKEEIKMIQLRATELRHESIAIRRAAMDLRMFSEAALITGTATIAGMMVLSKQYADANKEGDAQAARYQAQLNKLQITQNSIGKQFSVALMPFLDDLTNILSKADQFLKANPEVAKAAVKGAEILIGVGLVGKSVATAARLTADFLAIQSSILRLIASRAEAALTAEKEIAAAEAQNIAADKQLAAAEGQNAAAGSGGVTKAATGGIIGGLTSPAAVTAIVAGSVLVSAKISSQLETLERILNQYKGGLGTNVRFFVDQMAKVIPGGQILAGIEQLKYIHAAVKGILGKFSQQVDQNGRRATTPASRSDITNLPVGSVSLSKNLEAMLEAYQSYMDDDLALVTEHYNKRQDIIAKALEAVNKENERYAKNMQEISKDLADKLSNYARDYTRQSEKDERDWQRKRADVVRDASDEILRIEEDLRDKLRKLALEHADRQAELLAARDALGFVKEQRRYQREQDEAVADANKEIARHRKDIAQRLADIDREYQEERQRRLQDYQERVLEAQQEAADRKLAEQERHKEEMKQIAKEEAEKLAEEEKNFALERKKNYDQFIKRLRDLDAYYLGETERQRAHHQQMIADLDAFLTTYRGKTLAALNAINSTPTSTTAGGGTVGHRAFGGYATFGNYVLGDQPTGSPGPAEFVMNGSTTKAAEEIVGGKLTQSNIVATMSKGTTIVWNDHRTFDSRIPLADRRAIMEDTKRVIQEMLQ